MEGDTRKSKNTRCSSLRQMVYDFCGYTSFGGLGRAVGTKYIVFKVLWVMLFVGAVSMAVFQLIPLFYKYQSRPISTRISLKYSSALEFPSVVICNFNMIRKSQVDLLPRDIELALQEYYSEGNKKESYDDDDDENDDNYDDDYEDEEDEINPDMLDGMYKAEEKLSVLMAEVNQDNLMPLGHQFDDMIRSCTFKGVNCSDFTKYWSHFWHYKYGNCFVFNPSSAKKEIRASKPGPLYGLSISMNIEQDEYIDQLTENAGAVVLMSVRGQMPFPYEEGLSLAPGFSTSMGLKLMQINREDPFKNGSCIKDNEAGQKDNIYAKAHNISYSRTACEQSCLALSQLSQCNCMEYKFPVKFGFVCDILNRTVVSCLRKVAKKAKNNSLACLSDCRPQCSEKVFQITSSFSSWPSTKYLKYITQGFDEDSENNSDIQEGQQISNNYLKIQIFFQELNYEMIEESVSYQIENFLSDIGGQLGLWLGASVLSGVEVVELLAMMLIYLLTSRNGKNNNPMKTSGDSVSEMEEGLCDKNTPV